MWKRRNNWTWAVICFGCVTFSRVAIADQITLRDGRTLDGDVTAEDQGTVSVGVSGQGIILTVRVKKSQIKTWDRPVRQGPPYVLLPIVGEIGKDVTAASFRAGLDEARSLHPRYIVLAIDSPGGDVGEMEDMIDLLIAESRNTETIAYVKNAYSAAAVFAMTCHRVYVTPTASIGAAVPFTVTEQGPADVDAKFRSVFDAKVRAATEHGGHADLFVRGMSELDLEIFVAQENGQPVLHTRGPGKLIKSKGQILCLTASEAGECGLAGIAADIADVGKQATGGPWYEASHRPWNAVVGVIDGQRAKARYDALQRQHAAARREAIAAVLPEVANAENRVAKLTARSMADKNNAARLIAAANGEAQQAEDEYQQALKLAQFQSDQNAWTAHAVEVRNARLAEVRQNLQASVSPLQTESDAADLEAEQLRAREKQLLASIPSE